MHEALIAELKERVEYCKANPTLYDFYRSERRRLLAQCKSHREITRRFKPGAEALKWVQRDIAAFRQGWRATRLATAEAPTKFLGPYADSFAA